MRRINAARLLTLSLLLLLPASSHAKETWASVQTKNFTVIGNAAEGDIRKLATRLERFRHVLSLLFPRAQIETPVPTTVVLFKSHDSFKPFKPLYNGKPRDNVAGYFLPTPDVNYIALTSEDRGATPYEVIFHEYEHFIMRANLPNAPVWLNEGLAEFYSTFTTEDDDQKAALGMPIPRHILALRQSPLLPLKTLLEVDRKSPHYNESRKAGIFYAESWALIHYLMLSDGGKRQPQLAQFIRGLSDGVALEENFRQSFQADYKTVEAELRAYVGKFLFPVLNVTFAKQLDFAKEMQSARMSEAQTEYYLGDLLLRHRRLEEAEERLQKAIELDPKLAPAYISLGVLRLQQQKQSEAEKLMRAAVESDPGNYLSHFYRGVVLRLGGQNEEAVKAYEQAVKLKPDAARAFSELGHAHLSMGRDEEAIEAFKQSVRFDPKNAYTYRTRSYVYLRLARGVLAATDALNYIKRQGWADDRSAYMALAAHFGFRQQRRDNPYAAKVLEDAAAKLDAAEWPYPVIQYLRRAVTAEKLLEQATDNDKLTEAHAYVGLDLALEGRDEAALTHLKWVRENGNRNFVEYPLALAEITRIEARAGRQGQ
ncbi:MAG TPA: tetratricopeptide repeat protein [Pyrinomonadaceae bacterium]|nr:tetratricopeptide repeat protein [Pyrinomonadaceae bacterium]